MGIDCFYPRDKFDGKHFCTPEGRLVFFLIYKLLFLKDFF